MVLSLGKIKLIMNSYSSMCIVVPLDVFEYLHCNNNCVYEITLLHSLTSLNFFTTTTMHQGILQVMSFTMSVDIVT
jgi:hypothetical protein